MNGNGRSNPTESLINMAKLLQMELDATPPNSPASVLAAAKLGRIGHLLILELETLHIRSMSLEFVVKMGDKALAAADSMEKTARDAADAMHLHGLRDDRGLDTDWINETRNRLIQAYSAYAAATDAIKKQAVKK